MKTSRYRVYSSRLVLAFLFLSPGTRVWSAMPELRNELAYSGSPYLVLHAQDPVHWQTWSAQSLALAKKSGRLLYVSDGYYACLWCHVMQRESYRDPRIAAYLNEHFIPVKVDRELNTSLDDALQNFAAAVIHQGGWPLNAFVTPEGYPLTVVLYQPPTDFLKTLTRVNERWSAESAKLSALAKAAVPREADVKVKPYDMGDREKLVAGFLKQSMLEADTLQGGFGEVAKFPHVPQLALLLEWQARSPDAVRGKWLQLTLDAMAQRGLYDHVHGGFFRYTTDPAWTVPHFEKMLYDNSQLAMLYMRAAKILKRPEYESVVRDTLGFMLAFLRDPQSGGFYSSTSAVDEQGGEGAFYLWRKEELKSILPSEEYTLADRIWKLDQPSPFDSGAYLPANYVEPDSAQMQTLGKAYVRLEERRKGDGPPRDKKMLTGLNGLALSAFSRASQLDANYRKAAQDLYRFMQSQWRNGRLVKGRFGDQVLMGAELEDYAYGATGLRDYAQVFGNKQAAHMAAQWANQAWSLFSGKAGWKGERTALLKSVRAQPVLEDGALPSPSAALIAVSLSLGDRTLANRAEKALDWRDPDLFLDPFAYPSQLGLIIDASKAQ